MIITLRDGEEVNEIHRGEDAQQRFDDIDNVNFDVIIAGLLRP